MIDSPPLFYVIEYNEKLGPRLGCSSTSTEIASEMAVAWISNHEYA